MEQRRKRLRGALQIRRFRIHLVDPTVACLLPHASPPRFVLVPMHGISRSKECATPEYIEGPRCVIPVEIEGIAHQFDERMNLAARCRGGASHSGRRCTRPSSPANVRLR